MSRATLEVWWDGAHVGRFTQADRWVSFAYDEAAPQVPISLSLPREGGWTKAAPARYLDNLLPDSPAVRARWAALHGCDADTFSLMSAVGHDVAGALVILPEDHTPREDTQPAQVVTEDDLAARIIGLRNDPGAWQDPALTVGQRFSLAGTQGKFTAARIGSTWLWPNANLPSTHIFKPARGELTGLDAIEAATLNLASSIGVPSNHAEIMTFHGQSSFVTERFDRDTTGPMPRRLHAEDLAQALGIAAERKYTPTAEQIVGLLRGKANDEVALAFLTQLAFNTAIGNADAHAKNYSILLSAKGVRLAPVYDAVPTRLWPGFDQHLAMSISGARDPAAVTVHHWAKLARRVGLDPDVVATKARVVATAVRNLGRDVFVTTGVPTDAADRLGRIVAHTTKNIAPDLPRQDH